MYQDALPGLEPDVPRDALLGGANGGVPVDPDLLEDARVFLKGRKTAGGRLVSQEEMHLAAAVLTSYRRASGRRPSLGPWLSKIIARRRDYPSFTEADFVRVVESAWRLRWWERRGRRDQPPTPAVIFGNERCFERIVADAELEQAGEVKPGRKYGREVIR